MAHCAPTFAVAGRCQSKFSSCPGVVVTTSRIEWREVLEVRFRSGGGRGLPRPERLLSEAAERVAGCEVALKFEVIVDGFLHLGLPPSSWLMRTLGPIVLPPAALMQVLDADVAVRWGVRPQVVSHQPLRGEGILLRSLRISFARGVLVALGLASTSYREPRPRRRLRAIDERSGSSSPTCDESGAVAIRGD